MAQSTSSTGALTAGVLLRSIPAGQQTIIARELLADLRDDFDNVAASVVIELVSRQQDALLSRNLLDVLKARIISGEPQAVATLVQQSTEVSGQLLDLATTRLTAIASHVLATPGMVVMDFSSKITTATSKDLFNAPSETSGATAPQWLQLAKDLSAVHACANDKDVLFRAALCLLGVLDKATALAARELVFVLLHFTSNNANSSELLLLIITALISAQDSKLHQTLGYSLWLRTIAAYDDRVVPPVDISPRSYWQPILSGLRYGDTERRKLCLDILKRSVAIALEQGRIDLVTGNHEATPTDVIAQYSRYCSVFETLVLARYTNLLVECESDLDLLASSNSAVNLEWLFVLLGTGLDARTQDQNRRFMGNWILGSSIRTEVLPSGFARLLENEFLPWVTEGTLFVSSTKQYEDVFHCFHGERLAEFVRFSLQQHTDNLSAASTLLDTILRYVTRRKSAMFAHAAVHLLRGVGKAFEASDTYVLTTEQLEHILDVSGWRMFPEVASDFLLTQCHRLLTLSTNRSSMPLAEHLSAIGRTRLRSLQAAVRAYGCSDEVDDQALDDDALHRSHRDVAILEGITKCQTLASYVENIGQPPEISNVKEQLEDIWTDLDFLEFPRELLMHMPAAMLHLGVLNTALLESEGDEFGLRAFLVKTLPRLQDLTAKRSFLLAPLVISVRTALLHLPELPQIFNMAEFFLHVAQRPPEESTDLKLEYATVPFLEAVTGQTDRALFYFGQGEGHGFAAYLDLASRIGEHQPELVKTLIETILERWKRQKIPPPTMSKWKTTLQLQLLLVCLEQYTVQLDADALQPIIKDLLYVLSIEPLPRYRYLMEWMIVRMQIRHPELRSHVLQLMATKDHHSNPKFLASLMKIGIMLASTGTCTSDFALDLATAFIALSASSKIVIRHEAQWSFPMLTDYAKARGWDGITENPAYVALDEYIRSLPRFDDPPPERFMTKLDPIEDNTMTNLVEGLWTDLDYTRPPFASREDFVKLHSSDLESYPPSCMLLGSAITRPPRPLPQTVDFAPKLQVEPKQLTQDEAVALQTKGTAYLKSALTSPESTAPRTHSLLLVASLIENPYNLGGLSRCAEIFGAQALYVRDPRVVAEKDFTSVSVSSHNHLDIQACAVQDLSAFLGGKKAEGWTIVGIEQTDRSVLLGAVDENGQSVCVLPKRTVLVLGSEREGMPATVISECDMLVEIPQIGVTRSLNVQTAAATVLFEYGRQHKLPK